jgi:hypothetical protein
MRTQKNVNGITHASDTAEGWSVKVPTASINSVIQTLAFCQSLPQVTETADKGKSKRGRKPSKAKAQPVAAAPVETAAPETGRRVGRPKGSTNKPKVEETKKAGPNMHGVLAELAAKGPVTRDALALELKANGFVGGPVAMFLGRLKWDGNGTYAAPN